MKAAFFLIAMVFLLAGCGPVTNYDGVFDPDNPEVDEEMLLEVDEDITEEQ